MSRKLVLYVMACLMVVLSMVSSVYPETQIKKFKKGDSFVIALVPEKNVFDQRIRYMYIADYLSRELGLNIEIEIMVNYEDICKAFINHRADAGFFGSFSYILARDGAGVEPIARPVRPDGSSTYSGYIFVRKDSGIKTAGDMKDKRLALVSRATTAGYVFQKEYFSKHGFSNLEDYFSRIYFAGSHDASAWSVYIGEADVGGGKNHVFNSLAQEYPDFRENMVILAESPEVPSNGLAVAGHVESALKERFKKALLDMDKNSRGRMVLKEFRAVKFIDTKDGDYSTLKQMIKDAGIDLNDYACN